MTPHEAPTEISRRVGEAPARDHGNGVVRLDPADLIALGAGAGSNVLVCGGHTTVGRAELTERGHRRRGMVFLDQRLRARAGVGLGDLVTITAAGPTPTPTACHAPPPPGDAGFDDVGGLAEPIARLREVVELPLQRPEVFRRLGIRPPRGVLLHGPPGTGKTLLARVVARETRAAFFLINGPEIAHPLFGESERHLREVWREAEAHAPAIVCLDELDSLAPRREAPGAPVERRILAQLLTLMDGFCPAAGVVVIGATNLPGLLDPALRRPGRFDAEIEIPAPDRAGRAEILRIHTRRMPLGTDVDLDALAGMTPGWVGAQLEWLCREAAMTAWRRACDHPTPHALRRLTVPMQAFREAARRRPAPEPEPTAPIHTPV